MRWFRPNKGAETACTHRVERPEWVESEHPITGDVEGAWQTGVQYTTRDIGIGAYQCTACGEVMYYTGLWRQFYECGIPVPSSDLVSPAEVMRVRVAAGLVASRGWRSKGARDRTPNRQLANHE